MRKKLNEALLEIQKRIDSEIDFDKMLSLLAKEIVKVLKVRQCAIFKVSKDSEKFILVAVEPQNDNKKKDFSFEEMKTLKDVVYQKKFFMEDSSIHEKTKLFFVPFIVKGKVIGIIEMEMANKKRFNQEKIDFSLQLANLVELLLERDIALRRLFKKELSLLLKRIADETAHNLRNPITVVGGFARRLPKKLKKLPCEKELIAIKKESQRLESITDCILNSMNLERQRFEDSQEEVYKLIEKEEREIVFAEQYKIKLDKKWRFALPKRFREQLRDELFIFIKEGENALEIYPFSGIKDIKPEGFPGAVIAANEKITIPRAMRNSVSFYLGPTVNLVGKGDHIEIWPWPDQ